jgi:hypothetical protein
VLTEYGQSRSCCCAFGDKKQRECRRSFFVALADLAAIFSHEGISGQFLKATIKHGQGIVPLNQTVKGIISRSFDPGQALRTMTLFDISTGSASQCGFSIPSI